jgi:hypothetical protein
MFSGLAFATAPTITQGTTGKQSATFDFVLTTANDANCIADWNTLKGAWQDFNGTRDTVGTYYMTPNGSAGTRHSATVAAGEYTSRTIAYCCVDADVGHTWGQKDVNATCGSQAISFYYSAADLPQTIIDLIVGALASVYAFIAIIGLALAVVVVVFIGRKAGIRKFF